MGFDTFGCVYRFAAIAAACCLAASCQWVEKEGRIPLWSLPSCGLPLAFQFLELCCVASLAKVWKAQAVRKVLKVPPLRHSSSGQSSLSSSFLGTIPLKFVRFANLVFLSAAAIARAFFPVGMFSTLQVLRRWPLQLLSPLRHSSSGQSSVSSIFCARFQVCQSRVPVGSRDCSRLLSRWYVPFNKGEARALLEGLLSFH